MRVISNVVGPDQTCAVPGRSIHDGAHLLRDIYDYAEYKHCPAAFLSLDQSKAFDRVSHRYLMAVLEAFGFNKSFRDWVCLLYTDIYSKVIIDGDLSLVFSISRSIRQGCSLSALLYILSIEPLAIYIREDSLMCGLRLPGERDEARISLHADDTTVIVTDHFSIKRCFELVELYCKASGAKLNKEKCKAVAFGSWHSTTQNTQIG